jgi:hypothetical protein
MSEFPNLWVIFRLEEEAEEEEAREKREREGLEEDASI